MSIQRAAFWSMGSQYISFAIQFAVSVIIARFFLGPSEMGLFSIGLTVAMMVSVLQDFGISRYIIGQRHLTPDTIRTCASLSCVFSALVAGLILMCAWPAAIFYQEPRLFWILAIIAGSYSVVPWSVIPVALITRDMDFKNLFKVNVSGVAANAITGLSLAYLGFSAESLAWATVAQSLMRACMGQIIMPCPIKLPLQFTHHAPVTKFGSAASALSISGAIGVRSPDLIIGRMLGFASVGLYSRASALAGQLHNLVLGAMTGIFYPAFARLRDKGEDFGPHYERVVAAFGAIVWPSMAMLAIASYPVIDFLYGDKWVGAAPLLMMLAISEIFFITLPLHVDIPILLGRFKTLLILNVADTVASITTLIVASHFSLFAAASSRIIYGIIWFIIYARFMHAIIGFRWKLVSVIYLKSLLLCGLTIAPIALAYQYWLPSHEIGFIKMIPLIFLGGLLWLGGLFALRHPARSEIVVILRLFAAMPFMSRFINNNHKPD